MEGIEHGMMFGRINHLEIATYGDVSYDGVERPWSIK